jgi:hypothetical protein
LGINCASIGFQSPFRILCQNTTAQTQVLAGSRGGDYAVERSENKAFRGYEPFF